MKLYYKEETKKALNNFPFSNSTTKIEFIYGIIKIKKAVALANFKAGNINSDIKNAIIKSCDMILSGGYEGQFPISSLQGGAGTATHMNVNEVIASIAEEISKIKIHPIDDVNASQSTNDVNPSALRITIYYLLEDLNIKLNSITKSFEIKSKEFKDIIKLGRTHLQDAIPTTLGKEFEAYVYNLNCHKIEIKRSMELCRVLNLGGTAIGNSMNANAVYIREVYKELNIITGGKFLKAGNLMAKTSSQTDFIIISQMITTLCVELSKIANDFRFMSSGPHGGIGELLLPELQKGSSIMPGKINPVIPETVNQLYYIVSGNNLSIEKAVENSQMELGVMLPVIVDRLIESIKLSTEVINQFDNLCVKGLKADKERCQYHLENSNAYATMLVPILGYDTVASIVKKAENENKNFRTVLIEGKYMSDKEFSKIIKTFKF